MYRSLLWIAVPLFLLLVGVAAAGEGEDLERAVQQAAEKVERLLVQADEEPNPEKRAKIMKRVEAARAKWQKMRAKLAAAREGGEGARVRLRLGPARAREELEGAVQKAAEMVERLRVMAHEESDPAKREQLVKKAEAAHARWQALKAKLHALQDEGAVVLRGRVQMEDAAAAEREEHMRRMHEEARAVFRAAQARYEKLRHGLEAAEEARRALEDSGRVEAVERMQIHMRRIAHSMEQLEKARAMLEEAKGRLEGGRFEAAKEALQAAAQHVKQAEAVEKDVVVSGRAGRVAAGQPRPGARAVRAVRPGPGVTHGFVPGSRRRPAEAAQHAREMEEARRRAEHLAAAAGHLREAGAHREADAIEAQVREIHTHLERHARGEGGDPAHALMEAIQDLRREVGELRAEVRELRELLAPRRRR